MSLTSRRDLAHLAETQLRFETPTNIMARSRQSWRDGGNLAAVISPRFRNSQTLWRDLYKSWRDLHNLGEIDDISPRTRQYLESRKHYARSLQISARSW